MNLYLSYNKFATEKESLYLLGYFNDDLTVLLAKLNSIQSPDDIKMNKRLSFLTVETFQNIVRHGYDESEQKTNEKIKLGMFAFSKLDTGIILGTANHIPNSKTQTIENELNELNKLDTKELKEKYIDTLYNSDRTENGGAGVGFMSILRKTTGKINFKINKVDDKLSNFIFQSNLMNSEDIQPEFITEIHFNFMNDNNILLFRKGEFDHDTMVIMTNLLNVKLNLNVESDHGKRLFFVVGELIQNIYNHGYKQNDSHEGIFMVKKENEKLMICSGNFILSTKINELTEYFKLLNSLDEDGVKKLFKEKLYSPIEFDNEPFTSGIGLIEIKKNTQSPINFTFEKVDESLSFLTICINI